MSAETGYNGWRNYETWAVALWIDNEQGSYSYWHEQAESVMREHCAQSGATDRAEYEGEREWIVSRSTWTLAEMLKSEHEDALADAWDEDARNATVFSDLLNAALSEVDWHEVAEHYIGEHLDEIIAEMTVDDDESEVKPA